MIQFPRDWNSRKIIADTLTFSAYSIYAGGPILAYEAIFSGLMPEQWIAIRIACTIPRIIFGSVCGIIEDSVETCLTDASSGFFRKAVAGATALAAYQLPLYVISAAALGASTKQILTTCAIYVISDITLGWSYSMLLVAMRRFLRVRATHDP